MMTSPCLVRCFHRPPLFLRRSVSATTSSSKSPFYVQTFGPSTEQFLLLLPQLHLPLGRIALRAMPPTTAVSQSGPTPVFFHAITPEDIRRDWATFVENAGFREVLQRVVGENIAGEEMLVNEARSLPGGNGWIHLCDERALPAYVCHYPLFLERCFSFSSEVRLDVLADFG